MITRAEAASRRARNVRQPVDRPSQRRCAPHGDNVRGRVVRRLDRSSIDGGDGSPLVFDGFASITGVPYEMHDAWGPYSEIVHVGAFAETLATPDLDVPLVLSHDPMRVMARTIRSTSNLILTEVTEGDITGLRVLAPNLDPEDPDVRYVAPKLRSGLVDEMSFRFGIVSGRWSDDFESYHIHAVDLDRGDVSVVGKGANPYTTASLRSASGRTSGYYRSLIGTYTK